MLDLYIICTIFISNNTVTKGNKRKMSKIKPTNTVLLQGWMITELGLSGTNLIIYALIYGFTQTEEHWFSGSVEYISQWANVSERTVQRSLPLLEEQGLIEREVREGRTTRYRANLNAVNNALSNISSGDNLSPVTTKETTPRQSVTPTPDNMSPGGANMSPNNNIYNNKDNNIINNQKGSEEDNTDQPSEPNIKPPTNINPVEEVVNYYNTICVSFPKLTKVTPKRQSAVRTMLKSFTVDESKQAFELAEKSDFLSGRKKTDKHSTWRCGFDWLINPNNMVKVLEGNYNKESRIASEPRDSDKKYWEKQMEKTNGLF